MERTVQGVGQDGRCLCVMLPPDSPLLGHETTLEPFFRFLDPPKRARLCPTGAVRVFVAQEKLPDVQIEDATPFLDMLKAKEFLDAADWISRNALINDVAFYLRSTLYTMMPSLVLECFNEKELAAILGSPDKPLAACSGA